MVFSYLKAKRGEKVKENKRKESPMQPEVHLLQENALQQGE